MIPMHGPEDVRRLMNEWGSENKSFFFCISFDRTQAIVVPFEHCKAYGIQFRFPNHQIETLSPAAIKEAKIKDFTLPAEENYRHEFDQIQYHLHRGDTYLLNLTAEVPIVLDGTLHEVYHTARALFKVHIPDRFVCFSPERFIQIDHNILSTHPMKGTLSADVPQAREKLLSDPKETAEHYTIVDLLRNDLSRVGRGTSVERFRYLTEIERKEGNLLQMSSHIQTGLAPDWPGRLGDIFYTLLPAGSITGAPKQKTVEIIQKVESHRREFYTGVAGIFHDGKVDSAILIRYIGQREKQYYYKTGGGITTQSHWKDEYNEIREKIYIPLS